MNKDTIYIDVDDEITGIIDKLQNSNQKVVALVLPKRASVFQSIVNMKLLKRKAEEAGKHVVLVTSEASLMPLAGAVGMHMAKTAQSKPEIPSIPGDDESDHADEDNDDEPVEKPTRAAAVHAAADEETPIQVDNSADDTPSSGKGKKGKKGKGGKEGGGKKKFKIPNFEQFRTRLILGVVALVVLIVGAVLAFFVMPKATITLKTDTQTVDSNFGFAADPAAQEVDSERKVIPAKSEEYRKTDTEKVPATGQKDLGAKAVGQVVLSTSCSSSVPTVAAGTGLSSNSLSFTTTNDVTLAPTVANGQCRFQGTADVAANSPGEQFNIASGQNFTVSGYSSVSGSNPAVFAGGTSKIVKIVRQEDVDLARQRINDRSASDGAKEIEQKLEEGDYLPLPDTITSGNATVTSTPNVSDEAGEVTVTATTVYTMIGVKKDDLKKLVEEDAKSKIDTSKQQIQDNGIDDATIKVSGDKKPNARTELSFQATVTAGPQLDADSLKKEIAGKKRGEVQEIFKQRPGIQDVDIHYSPFWVTSTPKKMSKITIEFEKSNNNANQDNKNP